MATVTEPPEPTGKRFECAIDHPPLGFDTPDELHEHLLTTHPQLYEKGGRFPNGPFICPECGRHDFKSLDALRGHSRIHKRAAPPQGGQGGGGQPTQETTAMTDADVYAEVKLRGPEGLHKPLRARLENLLSTMPDIPQKSSYFILTEWDGDPSVRLDFRALEHLIENGGLKPSVAVYITNQLISLYNHYADALRKEGYGLDLAIGQGQGVPPPPFGPGSSMSSQAIQQGPMVWTPSGWQSARQGYGFPQGPTDVASEVRRLLDEERRRNNPPEDIIELETTDPGGKPVRVKGTMTQIAALRSAGILAAQDGGSGVDVEGAINAATEPLKTQIASLGEKLADREKALEKLEADHKEDLKDAKADFEKKESELKDEIRDLEKDLKEMTDQRDRYRDDSLRKELKADNAEKNAADKGDLLKDALGENKELRSKLGSSGYSSDGMKAVSEVGHEALELAKTRQPFKDVIELGKQVLLGKGPETPPASSELTDAKVLKDAGLLVDH